MKYHLMLTSQTPKPLSAQGRQGKILSIFITGYAEAEKKEGMLANTPYVDPKGFFRIVPPAGWKIQEYPEDPRGKVAFMAPAREVEFRIMASVKDFSSFKDLYQTTLENAKDIHAVTNKLRLALLFFERTGKL